MKTTKLRTYNYSKGYKLKPNEEHQLTATFHNNKKFTYFGKTKKECEQKFINKFGTWKGFIVKKWTIYCG